MHRAWRVLPPVVVAVALAACGGETGGPGGDSDAESLRDPAGHVSSVTTGSDDAATPADRDAPSRPRTLYFTDITDTSGLGAFRQVNGHPDKRFITGSVGGGVALFDYDLDGDLDAYLTNGSRLEGYPEGDAPRDALFANDGAGNFTDVTAAAGVGDTRWTCGAFVADVDGNGRPDLYLTNFGPNALYLNREDGTFEEVGAAAGIDDPRWSTGASFLDADGDGDLDLYVANYVEFDQQWLLATKPEDTYRGLTVYYGPRGMAGAADRFYRNDGDGTFTDVSAAAGIDGPRQFGFQTVAWDEDGDGRLDLYVANDSVGNHLWRNTGKWGETGDGATPDGDAPASAPGFRDAAMVTGVALNHVGRAQAGMGVALGDYDGDLLPDLFVTNFSEDYHTLYRREHGGFYADVSGKLGLGRVTLPSLGWGCGFADFDSDGDLDLYAVNGHVYPQVDELDLGTTYAQRNLLLENGGARLVEPAEGGGPGFDVLASSRGSAVGDIDGDGDLDILISNLDAAPTLLRNDSAAPGNWLKIRLRGAPPNTDAIGARVIVTTGDRRQLRLVGTGGSFLSSDAPELHVGLGAATAADAIEVTWPDGRTETYPGAPAGQRVAIDQ